MWVSSFIISDAFGYLGSVGVMLSKEIFQVQAKWTVLYPYGVVLLSIVGLVSTIGSLIYFNRKYRLKVEGSNPISDKPIQVSANV